MINSALLALGGAFAGSEHSLLAYRDNYWPLKANDYLDGMASWSFDLAYTTTYKGGLNEDNRPSETYGTRLYSNFHAQIDLEVVQWYKYSFHVNADIFDLYPYIQEVWWTVPYRKEEEKFHVGLKGWREFTAGAVQVYYVENMKVCGESIVNQVRDKKKWNDVYCGYN